MTSYWIVGGKREEGGREKKPAIYQSQRLDSSIPRNSGPMAIFLIIKFQKHPINSAFTAITLILFTIFFLFPTTLNIASQICAYRNHSLSKPTEDQWENIVSTLLPLLIAFANISTFEDMSHAQRQLVVNDYCAT